MRFGVFLLRQTLFFQLFLLSSLYFFLPATSARIVEQVLVVIDAEPYTLSNFKDYAKTKLGRNFPAGDLENITKEDQEVVEQFITDKLLDAEVRLVGIKVSEEDINQYIDQIKQRGRLSDEDLNAALQREGVTMERYRMSIRAEIEKGEIINRQVRKKVNITSEDVERYYRQNPKRYTTADRVRLRHILLSLSEDAARGREEEVKTLVFDLHRRALDGENFADLARSYSQGAGASEGGDIGWVNRGSLLKEIEEMAFGRLAVGQVSEPLRTSLGYHLIKLEEKEAGRLLALPDVAGKIREELHAKALEERFQKWLKTDLRKKHRVNVKIPGLVFRPEEEKKGTVDTLIASSAGRKKEKPGILSYLNPFSYIVRTTPIEGEDAEGELSGINIVRVFGIPLFTTESTGDLPEPSIEKEPQSGSPQQSKGFFSTIWKSLNPFSKD